MFSRIFSIVYLFFFLSSTEFGVQYLSFSTLQIMGKNKNSVSFLCHCISYVRPYLHTHASLKRDLFIKNLCKQTRVSTGISERSEWTSPSFCFSSAAWGGWSRTLSCSDITELLQRASLMWVISVNLSMS